MLINAEEARTATNKINNEYIERILERPIREAIMKGLFYCYITFGDTHTILDVIAILKKGAINTIKLPMICFVIKLNGKELIFMGVYACADLHGRLDLFYQIQSFLNKDDILYILGDVIDRGPEGWKLFKEVRKDSRCRLLKGNHEDMCFKAMNDVRYGNYQDNIPDWFNNGGDTTFDQILADENGFSIYPLMGNLITQTEYINKNNIKIILNHSGFYQDEGFFAWEQNLLWDRKQYKIDFVKGWRGPEDVIVVHGHTPIPLMVKDMQETAWLYQKEESKYDGGAFWYADNHKVNLDTGACWTGFTVVLDLDSFDEHIFSI